MESILSIVAGWVSEKEMKALQMKAREQQYEEILSDLDDQVWKELSKAPPCEHKLWSAEFPEQDIMNFW